MSIEGKHSPLKAYLRIVIILVLGITFLAFCGVAVVNFIHPEELALISIPGLAEEQDLQVFTQAPPSVKVGVPFKIVILVRNISADYIPVEEISLPGELMKASVVTDFQPGTLQQRNHGDTTGFQVDYLLAPGAEQLFEITLQSRSPAEITGDVLVNGGQSKGRAGIRMLFSLAATSTSSPTITNTPAPTPTQTPIPPTATATIPPLPYQSIVKIVGRGRIPGFGSYTWRGSGTIISSDGLILTNAHMVVPEAGANLRSLTIYLTDQVDRTPVARYLAEVIDADSDLDIGLIRIATDLGGRAVNTSRLNLPFVELGDSDQVQMGDPITIMGYPGIGGDTITMTSGVAGGFTMERKMDKPVFIKTTAAITGGTSGGMVMDRYGRFVGIPSQLGYGGDEPLVDCQLVDTNGNGLLEDQTTCIPVGGFVNAIRPINLAKPMIDDYLKQIGINVDATSTPLSP
jgi:S1-C subfamily serine protease